MAQYAIVLLFFRARKPRRPVGNGQAPAAAASDPSTKLRGVPSRVEGRAKRVEPRERGCPPPLVAEIAGDQLRRGLAVARMERERAEAEGPASSKEAPAARARTASLRAPQRE